MLSVRSEGSVFVSRLMLGGQSVFELHFEREYRLARCACVRVHCCAAFLIATAKHYTAYSQAGRATTVAVGCAPRCCSIRTGGGGRVLAAAS